MAYSREGICCFDSILAMVFRLMPVADASSFWVMPRSALASTSLQFEFVQCFCFFIPDRVWHWHQRQYMVNRDLGGNHGKGMSDSAQEKNQVDRSLGFNNCFNGYHWIFFYTG